MKKTVNDILKRISEVQNVAAQRLLEKNNPDPAIVHARRLAAHILSHRWDDPDEGRVQQRLRCSIEFVRQANDLAEIDESFHADVRTILGAEAPTEAPIVPVSAPPGSNEVGIVVEKADVDPEVFLFRLAELWYGYTREKMFEKKTSYKVARVRRVLIYVAKRQFRMNNYAVAELLQCAPETIKNVWEETRSEFDYDGPPRKELERVLNHFGLSLKEMANSSQLV